MKPAFQPSRILMLKSHSAGIGDLLRSSAAWRVLKNAYPAAELHLLFFTREPGYPSEGLMREHHLLKSFTAIDKRTRTLRDWRRLFGEVRKLGRDVRPDLVIDFEFNGVRTSLVSVWMALRHGARAVGVNSVAGRNLFYGRSAPGVEKYAVRHGIPDPLEYTERDFVALAAMGLERNGCPIEMDVTVAGRKFRERFRRDYGLDKKVPLLGLNVGCGTPGAGDRRPDLNLLSELAGPLQRDHGMRLVLTGAPFENEVNNEFIALHQKKWPGPIINLAGNTSLSELTGALKEFALFISPDSGPYHMAVALCVPTLCVFNFELRQAFHAHPWVRCCVVAKQEPLDALRKAAEELLTWRETASHTPARQNKS